jgi:hypothetical protein
LDFANSVETYEISGEHDNVTCIPRSGGL